MNLLRLAGLWAAYHFQSRSTLETRLRHQLEFGAFRFYPEFSGRVALYKLARWLRSEGYPPLALIPEYICNVVPMALEQAEYSIETYPVDACFEPDTEQLRRRLETGAYGIVLTASIYGSSALLDTLSSTEVWAPLLAAQRTHLIIDLCQDISLIRKVPVSYGRLLSVIVSFNDKSFPGAMGGGILTTLELPETDRPLPVQKRLQLYRYLFLKQLACFKRRLLRHATTPNAQLYDYSWCKRFPFTIEEYRIDKLQMIMALLGLANLERFHRRKKEFLEKHPQVLRMPFYETSPYLVWMSAAPPPRRLKRPYALPTSPAHSLRPSLTVIHNKGFCDD